MSVFLGDNLHLPRLTIVDKVYPWPHHLRLSHQLLLHQVVPLVPVIVGALLLVLHSPDQVGEYLGVCPVHGQGGGGEGGHTGQEGEQDEGVQHGVEKRKVG